MNKVIDYVVAFLLVTFLATAWSLEADMMDSHKEPTTQSITQRQ